MKKMIANPFVFCLLLLPLGLNGQKILVSEDMPLRNDLAYELLGDLKGNMLLFQDLGTSYEVLGFNEQMQHSWTKTLELDRRNAKILGVIPSKVDFSVLYFYRQRGETIVKAQKYDPAANLLDSTTIFNYGYLFFTPNFEVIRSDDRSKALIFFIDKQTIVRALSVDLETMKLLWEKSFTPEAFFYGEDFLQMLVDNEGNMHMVIDKDNFRSRRKQHYFQVHEYYAARNEMRQYNLPWNGNLTYDAYFSFDNLNKRLVGAGLYAEKDLSRADGYFYMNVDPDNHKDFTLTFEAFDGDFLATLLGKKGEKAKGVNEISVQEIVLRRDGGVLMIAEKNRIFERGGASRVYFTGQTRFMTDYYYDDLMVVSIHPNGQTHWRTILYKKQYSQDDDAVYSSYFLFKTPSNLRFLFNDEIRYENTISEYVLNGLGQYDRNSLLSTQNLELRLRFRDAVQTAANTLVVPSERRNRLKLVKMEY